MKKRLLSLITPILVLSSLALTGCGKKPNDLKTLNIICLNLGYGDIWIKNAVAKWESENPDYKVNLTASEDAASLISRNMASSNNTDDLYISVGTDWKTYAAKGAFLSLDDLIEEEVDGIKIKDKVNDEYANSIYYTNTKGETHTYRLPWTAGVGGIYYNAQMFRENEWDTWLKTEYQTNTTGVPETYEELIGLIEKIKEDRVPVDGDISATVKPFVYTGKNTDYFDYAVLTWWGQLAGKEAIQEFLKYETYTVFDASIEGSAYSKLKEAVYLWDNIFSDASNYVEGSLSKTNHQAQQDFLNGYCAMMFNGEWCYNEIIRYLTNNTLPESFDLKIMKTPTAPNAVEPDISYIVGEDQYIAIPASTEKAELAKSFIKVLVSDWGCENFTTNANGLLAYKWDTTDYIAPNSFVDSLIEYKNEIDSTFTNFSNSLMYLNNIIDIWGTSAMRPFNGILSQTSTVELSFQTIASETARQWDSWKKQAGID